MEILNWETRNLDSTKNKIEIVFDLCRDRITIQMFHLVSTKFYGDFLFFFLILFFIFSLAKSHFNYIFLYFTFFPSLRYKISLLSSVIFWSYLYTYPNNLYKYKINSIYQLISFFNTLIINF